MTPGGLFNELSPAEADDIALGPEAFAGRHPNTRLYPDPFLAPRCRPAAPRIADLILAPGDSDHLRVAADKLAVAVKSACGIEVKVISADQIAGGLRAKAPLVLLGNTSENVLSQAILRRFQLGIFDALFPGRGGWGVTCHGELAPGMSFRYVLSFDESTVDAAIDAFVEGAIRSGEVGRLCWMHAVSPGPKLSKIFPDYEDWLGRRLGPLCNLDAVAEWRKTGFSRPYREVFVDVLTKDYPEGVISNGRLIDMGIESLRYYQQIGDVRGLNLFREMLRGFVDYMNSSSPAIYPSDLDFRLGSLCDCWNWFEWHPSVTDEELNDVPKMLLGAMRLVHDYFLERWKYRHLQRKSDPGRRGELDFRHNHQTFPALTLMQGWRYFRRWELAEAEVWQEDSDYIFGVIRPESFKYSENTNSYEVYVAEQYLAWLEVNSRPIPAPFRDALAHFARRQWLMRDNFYQIVDYGDTGLGGLGASRPLIVSPWLLPDNPAHRDVIDLEECTGGLFEPTIAAATHGFTGLVMSDATNPPAVSGDWDTMPIDPLFAREFNFKGPAEQMFDKVCLRTGWQPDAFYLAMEGVGSGNGISHSHHEVNAVVRANFGGRMWLVSNGYGKQIGLNLAAKAFSSRQIGPVDHNMLLLKNDNADAPVLPPVNALLIDHHKGSVPFVVTEVHDYAGCMWRRHVFVLQASGVVIVDHLVANPGERLPDQVWLEWNVLGDVIAAEDGAIVEQKGVSATFRHFSCGSCEWAENGSADWHSILGSGAYPYASRPLRKAIVRSDSSARSGEGGVWFATGLWLTDTVSHASWAVRGKKAQLDIHLADGSEPVAETLEIGDLTARFKS